MLSCYMLRSGFLLDFVLAPEDGGDIFCGSGGGYLADFPELFPRRYNSAIQPLVWLLNRCCGLQFACCSALDLILATHERCHNVSGEPPPTSRM
jgi:hypothetical protein